MNIRRLTPSPTELAENTSYLLSLRPRDLQDQILDTLKSNDLPLVQLEEALDFKLIKRLIAENARTKADLIGLSLSSYQQRDQNSTQAAETLLNYLLSRLSDQELFELKALLATNVIDDTIISNVINLIRLTGIRDPLKFVELLESSLSGTVSLRNFMGNLNVSTAASLRQLDNIGAREVSPDIINAINEKESIGLLEINEKANAIENEALAAVDAIRQAADVQRILLNTGITFGVTGFIWAGFRFGLWESLLSLANPSSAPMNLGRQSDPGVLGNLQLGLAGLTGFLLKKGLLRR